MNEEFEDLKKTAKERITGPLSYITISFIIYNWAWFYFLIFSNKIAEDKIYFILSFFPKATGTLVPIGIGIFLAILMPITKIVFKKIMTFVRRIDEKIDQDDKNFIDNYVADKKIELANKSHELVTKETAIDDLRNQKTNLLSEISKYHASLEQLRNDDADIKNSINDSSKIKHDIETFINSNNVTIENFHNLNGKLLDKANENFELEYKIENLNKIKKPEISCLSALLKIIKSRPDWVDLLSSSEREDIEYIANIINYDHEKALKTNKMIDK
ncbi:hypothetical protein [Serratia quinivorans]|uniref:hypothetical protein n=1 Tax=Serratia quinivorans TaxID=137545 RepID=UPI00217B0928|nr:hypothetical protein [Serratia quinivorans]CAI1593966.1 Uncharacterised protein [Serratia quinivorans]CAI1673654.1 Uncharacterised protein [Serratia quinivorans]